jgi:hypothetical protein
VLASDRLAVLGSTGKAPVIAGGEGAVLRPRWIGLWRNRGAIDQCGSWGGFHED